MSTTAVGALSMGKQATRHYCSGLFISFKYVIHVIIAAHINTSIYVHCIWICDTAAHINNMVQINTSIAHMITGMARINTGLHINTSIAHKYATHYNSIAHCRQTSSNGARRHDQGAHRLPWTTASRNVTAAHSSFTMQHCVATWLQHTLHPHCNSVLQLHLHVAHAPYPSHYQEGRENHGGEELDSISKESIYPQHTLSLGCT